MNSHRTWLKTTVTIPNALGLHARPAAQIAKTVQDAGVNARLVTDHETVDASSIIDILTLGCIKGSQVTLEVEKSGARAEQALRHLIYLFENGFGEPS